MKNAIFGIFYSVNLTWGSLFFHRPGPELDYFYSETSKKLFELHSKTTKPSSAADMLCDLYIKT